MNRFFLSMICIGQSFVGMSQNSLWIQKQILDSSIQKGKSIINIDASGSYNSNFMGNDLMNKFLTGGTIDTELKNKAKEKLSGKNYFNLELESTINYYCNIDTILKNTKIGLYFGASVKGIVNSKISDDAFTLALYGNRNFGENKISLSNCSFYQTVFESFQLGIFNKKTFSFLTLNIYSGSKLLNIETKNAYLQTTYNSIDNFLVPQQVTAEYNLSYTATDGKSKLLKSKGVGFGISGSYNLPIKIINKRSNLQFKIEDLGFIKWHKGINVADTVGKFSFNGFESSGLFNFDNPLLDASNITDSILPTPEKESIITLLPTRYSIELHTELSNKILAGAKVFYRANCKYNYGINIASDIKLKENFLLGAELNLFGFVNPNLIVNSSWHLYKNFVVTASILNPLATIFGDSTSGGLKIKIIVLI